MKPTDNGGRMRLGILSDTHNQLDRTRVAVKMLRDQGAEALIHCGDVTTTPIIEACGVLPLWFVFGNNDSDEVAALRSVAAMCGATCLEWGGIIELHGKRVGVTHGHLRTEVRKVLAERPDYLLSGHSHIASDSAIDDVRRINPGALHRARKYTVALLDLMSDELEFLIVPPIALRPDIAD